LLLNLALDNECIIVDCTSNRLGKVFSRGIPIIKEVLEYRWLGLKSSKHNNRQYAINNALKRETKRKLDYYKKFNPTSINLHGISIKLEKELEIC